MDQRQMMRQIQQMQAQMQRAQEELEAAEVEGSAGGGMVTAVVSGSGDVKRVKLRPEVVDPDDVEMLEDLIVAALTEARRSAADLQQQKMGGFTAGLGGLGIPGL